MITILIIILCGLLLLFINKSTLNILNKISILFIILINIESLAILLSPKENITLKFKVEELVQRYNSSTGLPNNKYVDYLHQTCNPGDTLIIKYNVIKNPSKKGLFLLDNKLRRDIVIRNSLKCKIKNED